MAGRWADGVAVVEHRGVRRYATSYGELATLARRFAAELDRRGIAPGDRMVLWGANSAAWMAAFFGCVLRGVLPVPLDAAGTSEFALRIVGEVAPRMIVGDRELLVALHAAQAPKLLLDTLPEKLSDSMADARPGLGAADPLQILFTSGTTGEPKGAVHTHGNLLASIGPIEAEIAKYRRYERFVHPLRFLHTLPLSHVFGQFMGLWVPPLLGAAVHYESRTTASHLLPLIPRERINVLAAVPRTLDLLRAHLLATQPQLAQQVAAAAGEPLQRRWWRFRRLHQSMGLRFWAMVCGGATLPAELEAFWTTLGFALIQGYGLTETAALVTLNHPFRTARGSLGAPLPGRSLRVSDTGELEVQGAMVSRASWQGGGMVARENPWLPTGDLAEMGEDGRVRLLGRTGQRLVTAAGLNVYLRDVEDALTAQPAIDEALVFPLPGSSGGDEPAAVLVSRAGSDAAEEAVARASQLLAPHQRVHRWLLWSGLGLPRTSTGKVKRAAVEQWGRAQFGSREKQGAGAEDSPSVDDPALALLRSVTGKSGPGDDSARLEADWGVDSMARVSLAAALEEQLGIGLDDGMAAGVQTVGELRRLVRGTGSGAEPAASVAELPSANMPQAPSASSLSGHAQVRAGEPSTAIAPAVSLPRMRYPAWPWSAPVAAVRLVFVEAVVRPLVWLLGRPRVVRGDGGAASAPMLLISNHRTAMDVPLLLYALPLHMRRRVAVAMSGEMLAGWEASWTRRPMPAAYAVHRRWWGPIASVLVRGLFGVFPLPAGIGFRQSFEQAGRALDRGYHVLIFPEGRRGASGELQEFRQGMGLLWKEAETAVLPMALKIEPTGRLRSRPEIRLGTPIPLAAAETMSVAERTRLSQRTVETVLDGS